MAGEIRPLVKGPNITLGMIGMTEGNGHPYSWSAIFNGYDPSEMERTPYPAIAAYLGKEPLSVFPAPGVRVTHVFCDDEHDAQAVSRASLVPTVVRRPEELIGAVDAVVVATDIGSEHVRRCRPFVEAGVPVFVDKPLVDSEDDLRTFSGWVRAGAPVMSSSAMRYCKEYRPYHGGAFHELGELRLVHLTMNKKWETYGIHALESMYPILGPGFLSIRNTGTERRNVLHITHERGVDVVIVVTYDMIGSSGMHLCGTAGHVALAMQDTFGCFKAQLLAFIEYLRTGLRPFPFAETEELMKLVIGGIRSREQGGRLVRLAEIVG